MATAAASARAGQLLAMLGLRSDVNTAEAFDSKENCHGEGCGFVAGDRKLPVTFYITTGVTPVTVLRTTAVVVPMSAGGTLQVTGIRIQYDCCRVCRTHKKCCC